MNPIFLSPVFAQITPGRNILPFQPGQGGVELLGNMLSTIITLLLVVGVLVCFLYMVIGSYRWISSKGDKNYLQEGRDMIYNAVIGLVILLAIFAILNLVGGLFGFDLMHIIIPTIIEQTT